MDSVDRGRLVKAVGDFLLHKRLLSGASVKEISARTGLTEQAIARLESGRSQRLDLVKIFALSKHLGFSIDELAMATNAWHLEPQVEGSVDNDNVDTVSLRTAVVDRGLSYCAVNDNDLLPGPCRSLEQMQIEPVSFAIDMHIFVTRPDGGYETKIFALNEQLYRQISIGIEDQRAIAHLIPNGNRDIWFKLRSHQLTLFNWHHIHLTADGDYFCMWVDSVAVDQIKLANVSEEPIRGYVTLAHEELLGNVQPPGLHRPFAGQIFRPTFWSRSINAFELSQIDPLRC